ncbi:MAG TPA: septum formation family protein, partial [Nocardioides sp.]
PTATAEAVDCAVEHTAQTYAVGQLATYADGHLLAVDDPAVQADLAQTCRSSLAEHLGGDADALRLSVLRPVWFSPSIEESDGGADWYRCDVIAVVDDGQLGALPPATADALAGDGLDSLALCATAAPGADGFRRIACGLEHSWRAIDVVDLGATYPGEDAASTAGSAQCQNVAGELADDVLDYQWGYEWPTPEQWEAGQTYGICWAPA